MSSHDRPIAAGKRIWAASVSTSGRARLAPSMSWLRPTVATSNMTRGRSKSRQMTVRSMTAPISAPMSRQVMRASQNGHPQLMTSSAKRVAPGRPMLPTAKLMTFVDR